MAFGSREEYERWKAQKMGGAAPLPPTVPPPAPAAAASAQPVTAAVPSAPVAAPASTAVGATATAGAPTQKKGFAKMLDGLPKWAYPFGIACVAIPVVTLGGGIPAAIGIGGASLVATIAKKDSMPVAVRAALCAAVTAAAWILLFVLLAAVGGARHR